MADRKVYMDVKMRVIALVEEGKNPHDSFVVKVEGTNGADIEDYEVTSVDITDSK